MSVDFIAILSHPFNDSDILTVPERLNADRESFSKAVTEYHAFIKQTGHFLLEDQALWHWEQGRREWKGNDPNDIWYSNDPITLAGPTLLNIHFGCAACDFSAPLRWSIFINDASFQLETRKVCFAITQAFAGDKAIYVPDSTWRVQGAIERVYENDRLEQIEDWLKKHIGEPSPTIAHMQELMKTQDLEDCYFVDYFSDLGDGQ